MQEPFLSLYTYKVSTKLYNSSLCNIVIKIIVRLDSELYKRIYYTRT